jgi:hypothetical protein
MDCFDGKQEEIDYLVRRLLSAKQTEEEAKTKRIACEEKLIALIPCPDRGQKTLTLSSGVKVTVEKGFNYKADIGKIQSTIASLSESSDLSEGTCYPAPVKTKTTSELDVIGYEWYRENHPEIFSQIAPFVTVTPKKTSVTVKAK